MTDDGKKHADSLRRDLNHERNRPQYATWVMLVLLAAESALLFWVFRTIPEPIVCPPEPDPVVCPTVQTEVDDAEGSAAIPTQRADVDGYWTTDAYDRPQHHTWPDASDYPAERFITDCHDVCEVTVGYGADRHPGRVLSVDPSHLICICLHSDSSVYPVTRWIGWERQ